MRSLYQVLSRPVITEKATLLKEDANQYVFRVPRSANKMEIRRAVEALFKVKVIGLQTLNVQGRRKRLGRFEGRTAAWKKAIVTLAAGQSIDVVEGS